MPPLAPSASWAPTALESMVNEKLYLIWVVLFHDTRSNRAIGARDGGVKEGLAPPVF